MKKIIQLQELDLALEKLDQDLAKQDKKLEIIVIGGYALYLHGILGRYTLDIDYINQVFDEEILELVFSIGDELGNDCWLNSQAKGMILPDGFYERLSSYDKFNCINISYAAKEDLIKLKIAAYFYRSIYNEKDLDDLRNLNITKGDLTDGVKFLMEKHRPDVERFAKEFDKNLDNTKTKLSKALGI